MPYRDFPTLLRQSALLFHQAKTDVAPAPDCRCEPVCDAEADYKRRLLERFRAIQLEDEEIDTKRYRGETEARSRRQRGE